MFHPIVRNKGSGLIRIPRQHDDELQPRNASGVNRGGGHDAPNLTNPPSSLRLPVATGKHTYFRLTNLAKYLE